MAWKIVMAMACNDSGMPTRRCHQHDHGCGQIVVCFAELPGQVGDEGLRPGEVASEPLVQHSGFIDASGSPHRHPRPGRPKKPPK
ncbi:hypothetical protein Ani05nite_59960 [Amorphoplanes nipponensis]|uniref:Uncharacterized protein n=1 Tax=Actinoplanes nipponensis TaxID=135950 RepID=A0A919MPV3_9ACTN|nr:hypothetical protein Ani05nite_59960 [Actinoplanes nipponensis]